MQIVFLILSVLLLSNDPPTVTLEVNIPTSNLETGAQIPYTITVSDPQDGESIYEEIPPNEVFLHVSYSLENQKLSCEELEGLTLIKQYDCFTCHRVKQKLVGPPFNDIAAKYRDTDADLSLSLLKGSSGKWSNDAIMPVNPEITSEDAKKMASWIRNTEQRANQQYFMGTSGIIRIDPAKKGWKMVLTAMYLDHGDEDSGRLSGCDHTIIHIK